MLDAGSQVALHPWIRSILAHHETLRALVGSPCPLTWAPSLSHTHTHPLYDTLFGARCTP